MTKIIRSIDDFAPAGVEAGVGLALQDEHERYLFFVAGSRFHCQDGELLYGGIGGHREPGEGWLDCARREAREEIGAEIEIIPAPRTWFLPANGSIRTVVVDDDDGIPHPLAFYNMRHLPGGPRAGLLYRLVIFSARSMSSLTITAPDEVGAVLALNRQQIVRSLERKPTLAELLHEGAALPVSARHIDPSTRLYPVGTAKLLAHVLKETHDLAV